MPTMRLLLLAVVVIALVIFLMERRHARRCPVCKSSKIKETDRTTDKIELNKREIPGIGSKVNVSATVSMRCHTCGHAWEFKDRS